MADARCEAVVDGRMAQCAGDADPGQPGHTADLLDRAADADHRVEPDQCERRRRTGEVGHAAGDRVAQVVRQGIDIHLEADRQRGLRIDRRLDHFVHAQRVAPESLVAEGVVAEDVAALLDPGGGVVRRAAAGGKARRQHQGQRAPGGVIPGTSHASIRAHDDSPLRFGGWGRQRALTRQRRPARCGAVGGGNRRAGMGHGSLHSSGRTDPGCGITRAPRG